MEEQVQNEQMSAKEQEPILDQNIIEEPNEEEKKRLMEL